jgi:hypothetical protein
MTEDGAESIETAHTIRPAECRCPMAGRARAADDYRQTRWRTARIRGPSSLAAREPPDSERAATWRGLICSPASVAGLGRLKESLQRQPVSRRHLPAGPGDDGSSGRKRSPSSTGSQAGCTAAIRCSNQCLRGQWPGGRVCSSAGDGPPGSAAQRGPVPAGHACPQAERAQIPPASAGICASSRVWATRLAPQAHERAFTPWRAPSRSRAGWAAPGPADRGAVSRRQRCFATVADRSACLAISTWINRDGTFLSRIRTHTRPVTFAPGKFVRSGPDLQLPTVLICEAMVALSGQPRKRTSGVVEPFQRLLIGETAARLLKRTDLNTPGHDAAAGLAGLDRRHAGSTVGRRGPRPVLAARPSGGVQNNANGTFRDVTAELGHSNSIDGGRQAVI